MLVLTRKLDESIVIGDGIVVKVISVRGAGDQAVVRLGIDAPSTVRVWRKEVYDQVAEANRAALATPSGDKLPVLPVPAAAPRLDRPGLNAFMQTIQENYQDKPDRG